MKLSQNQTIFLRMAKQGTAPRRLSNKTGKALKEAGLVRYSKDLGYVCTPEGTKALNVI